MMVGHSLAVESVSALEWDVLARDIVAAVAPEELAVFEPVREAFRFGPVGTALGRRKRDEALGSGIDGTVTLVTPVVLLVITKVLDHLADKLGEQVADRGGGVVRRAWRRIFRRHRPTQLPTSAAPPALTAGQLAEVREVAFDTARRAGLRETKARLLADALVGGLIKEP
jgi:hypothetical protein